MVSPADAFFVGIWATYTERLVLKKTSWLLGTLVLWIVAACSFQTNMFYSGKLGLLSCRIKSLSVRFVLTRVSQDRHFTKH